jgi:DNA processing protein
MRAVDFHIPELDAMKKYPSPLYAAGRTELLKRPKVSIIGSRRPTQYAQQMSFRIAKALAKRGVCIVSGAAMGVDAAAHRGAGSANTIAVLPSGIDVRYPVLNAELIASIEREGLTLSQFEPGFRATSWSFVVRNEVVVALGECLVVAQADPGSGSMRSVEYALEMGRKIFVLPHRIGESEGTDRLLAEGRAEAIYDLEAFADRFARGATIGSDPFLAFCDRNPTYEEAVAHDAEKLYSYELDGKIAVDAGRVIVL